MSNAGQVITNKYAREKMRQVARIEAGVCRVVGCGNPRTGELSHCESHRRRVNENNLARYRTMHATAKRRQCPKCLGLGHFAKTCEVVP